MKYNKLLSTTILNLFLSFVIFLLNIYIFLIFTLNYIHYNNELLGILLYLINLIIFYLPLILLPLLLIANIIVSKKFKFDSTKYILINIVIKVLFITYILIASIISLLEIDNGSLQGLNLAYFQQIFVILFILFIPEIFHLVKKLYLNLKMKKVLKTKKVLLNWKNNLTEKMKEFILNNDRVLSSSPEYNLFINTLWMEGFIEFGNQEIYESEFEEVLIDGKPATIERKRKVSIEVIIINEKLKKFIKD